MTQIILDFSANTFKNDKEIIKRGIDEIKKIDTGKHEIVFKTQLFIKAGDNIPCTKESFEYLYEYGNSQGYKVTSSVFDKESLDYLLKFDVPFIKIANLKHLHWLIGEINRKTKVYYSYTDNHFISDGLTNWGDVAMMCISQYPATKQSYIDLIEIQHKGILPYAISDHTVDFEIFNKYMPMIYECHYKLSDSTGLDAGSFARTPEQLKEIL